MTPVRRLVCIFAGHLVVSFTRVLDLLIKLLALKSHSSSRFV